MNVLLWDHRAEECQSGPQIIFLNDWIRSLLSPVYTTPIDLVLFLAKC